MCIRERSCAWAETCTVTVPQVGRPRGQGVRLEDDGLLLLDDDPIRVDECRGQLDLLVGFLVQDLVAENADVKTPPMS